MSSVHDNRPADLPCSRTIGSDAPLSPEFYLAALGMQADLTWVGGTGMFGKAVATRVARHHRDRPGSRRSRSPVALAQDRRAVRADRGA